jgi:hypothetical protein
MGENVCIDPFNLLDPFAQWVQLQLFQCLTRQALRREGVWGRM